MKTSEQQLVDAVIKIGYPILASSEDFESEFRKLFNRKGQKILREMATAMIAHVRNHDLNKVT